MRYNKIDQAYEIIERFTVVSNGETKEYCRVKFFATKQVYIVPSELVQSGELVDITETITTDTTYVDDLVIATDSTKKYNAIDAVLDAKSPFIFDVHKDDNIDANKKVIIATNPSNDEIEINESELFGFCESNKLDLEVVNKVLNGEQNTHRKYKFRYK